MSRPSSRVDWVNVLLLVVVLVYVVEVLRVMGDAVVAVLAAIWRCC